MPITVAIPNEKADGEKRIAIVPDIVKRLKKTGFNILVERGAGQGAFISDESFTEAGAQIYEDAHAVFGDADVLLKVLPPTNEEVEQLRENSIIISFMAPHINADMVQRLRDRKITSLAMELVPRISRAQSMDALSSQATVAGYKSVLIGTEYCIKFLPMLTTAAGTIRPAKILILGAGVAGLQAIATARRLGAIVEAYDVRRAAGEQVESLGAKFLKVELDGDAEAEGGYARELTADEKKREQEMLSKSIAEADIVITTAMIPGREAPRLIGREMVDNMKPGAVIVDLASESGGNCELTQHGQVIGHNGVQIVGPANLPSSLPINASEMYAKNLFNLMSLLSKDGENLNLDWNDEIVSGSALTHDGQIKHEPTRLKIEGGAS